MKVHITKLGAAQRQLRASIRMYFAGEDEFAVHTVASAAYGLLKDLKKSRGRDEATDYYLTTIFYAVRSYRRGDLPAYLADNPDSMKWIMKMAAQLPIQADSMFEDVCASITPETAATFWQKRNRFSNFLKHADRDSKKTITLEEIDNSHLLMQVLGAYTDLVNDDLGAEGIVFWLYFTVTFGAKSDQSEKFRDFASTLESIDGPKRLEFCSSLIRELNGRVAQLHASVAGSKNAGAMLKFDIERPLL